jgi:hypothetical protein
VKGGISSLLDLFFLPKRKKKEVEGKQQILSNTWDALRERWIEA